MMNNLLVDEAIIDSLVWTLIHSLWQFTIVGLVVSVLIKKFQDLHTPLRYMVSLAGLFTSVLISAVTFCYYYNQFHPDLTNLPGGSFQIQPELLLSAINDEFNNPSWIEKNKFSLIYLWLSGLVLLLLRMLYSIAFIKYIHYKAVAVLDSSVIKVFDDLIAKTGIKSSPKLKTSAHIDTPALIGFFKPVILLPISLVNQLTIRETEIIIAHELAHFVRKDQFINIIQTFIECIFYYHPAIWYISGQVRQEREKCCDQMAISLTGDKLSYARTLIKLQEHKLNINNPQLIMGFTNKNNKIFSNRIKHILKMKQKNSFIREKLITTFMIIGGVIMFARESSGSDNICLNTDNGVYSDTIPKTDQKAKVMVMENQKEIKISMDGGKVREIIIDGEKMDESELEKFSEMKVKPDDSAIKRSKIYIYTDDNSKEGSSIKSLDSLMMGFKFDEGSPSGFRQFSFDKNNFNEEMKALKESMKALQIELKSIDDLKEGFEGLDSKFYYSFPDLEKEMEIFGAPNTKEMKKFKYEFDFSEMVPEAYTIAVDRERNSGTLSDIIGKNLKKDKLLFPDKENIVELTGKHLKINGEKQPSNIWIKYKKIFEEASGTELDKNSRIKFTIKSSTQKNKHLIMKTM